MLRGKSLAVVSLLTLAASVASAQIVEVVPLAQAENQVFTPSGRHFASGGEGVVEVVASGGGFDAVQVGLDGCGSNGLAVLNDWLIAACNPGQDNQIYAGKLVEGELPVLELLFDLPNFFLANGVAISPAGAILVADFPFFGQGEVARIEVEDTGDDLVVVGYDPEFLGAAEGIEAPNGLKLDGQQLFITDNGRVLEVSLGVDDEYLGTDVFYSKATVFDDLTLLCGGVVVTDFLAGGLIFVRQDGAVFETPGGLFQVPSSVLFGQPPLYLQRDVLVTELAGGRISKATLPPEALMAFCML